MKTQTTHPSNRLYRGEVTDFEEALRTVVSGCDFEVAASRQTERACDVSGLTAYKEAALRALAVYREEMEPMRRRVIERLRADGDLAAFADALESGDYTGLAI